MDRRAESYATAAACGSLTGVAVEDDVYREKSGHCPTSKSRRLAPFFSKLNKPGFYDAFALEI